MPHSGICACISVSADVSDPLTGETDETTHEFILASPPDTQIFPTTFTQADALHALALNKVLLPKVADQARCGDVWPGKEAEKGAALWAALRMVESSLRRLDDSQVRA